MQDPQRNSPPRARRSRRTGRLRAAISILAASIVAPLLLASCDRQSQPDLAPRQLLDTEETAAYVSEFPADQYQIAEVPGVGRFYIDDNPAFVKKRLLSGQPWEPEVVAEMKKHLEPGDVVLDVGAHIGALSIPISRIVTNEGSVYAFEPQRKIFRELVKNIELNGLTNIHPLRFAISSEPGIIEMNPVIAHDGQVQIGKGGDEAEARTLDGFGFPRIDLIKIDVEGHELGVLQGGDETIRKLHPVIVIEIFQENRKTVTELLEGHGYTLRRIKRKGHDYVAVHRDS